jgi:ribonuclease HII
VNSDLSALWRHDRLLAESLAADGGGPFLLCGVDEVGRGPLAGNVVAACVLIDPLSRPILGLNDSKKLTAAKREALAPRIREEALAFAIGEATVEEIDTLNILQASLLAMRRAIGSLPVGTDPALVLVDGNQKIPGLKLAQRTVVGGDGLSASIAAASILAKVARDSALNEADRLYPQYGFARHKGYGTAEHCAALRAHGPCPLHRRTFAPDLMNAHATGSRV